MVGCRGFRGLSWDFPGIIVGFSWDSFVGFSWVCRARAAAPWDFRGFTVPGQPHRGIFVGLPCPGEPHRGIFLGFVPGIFLGYSWDSFVGFVRGIFLGSSWDFRGFRGISWDFPGISWDNRGISWDWVDIFEKQSWDNRGFS